MRILITGANGQLGQTLATTLADHDVIGIDLPDHDITRRAPLAALIADLQPDVVINSAAWTDVDGCARNPEAAMRANALGPHNLALICAEHDIDLVQISTNEVFAGTQPDGYYEWEPANPINGYGRSKAAGEFHVRTLHRRHYIVRTAWLYSAASRNFPHAILRRARETGQVRVVADEVGNPTYAPDLAAAIGRLITTRHYGTFHLVNAGSCSRWAFANAILAAAGLEQTPNTPISSSEFNRASTPPPWCALHDTTAAAIGITLRPWQDALTEFMAVGG
jgi:dTDP-4-dehydrorhamnose reductase